ncbi:hypothetical protein ACIRRX_20150 [Streptomyces bacillaris]
MPSPPRLDAVTARAHARPATGLRAMSVGADRDDELRALFGGER